MGICGMTQGAQTGALGQPRGVGGGREVQEGRDTGQPMADACGCLAETHTILQRDYPSMRNTQMQLSSRTLWEWVGGVTCRWQRRAPRTGSRRLSDTGSSLPWKRGGDCHWGPEKSLHSVHTALRSQTLPWHHRGPPPETSNPRLLRNRFPVCSSVQSTRSVVSDSLRPHGLQHARPPCPSPTPGACSNPCPWSRWCHPTSSSSVAPFSSRLQSCPASGSLPVGQFFTSYGQSVRASASVLPVTVSFISIITPSAPPHTIRH